MLGVAFFIAIAEMMCGMLDYFIEKLIDVVPHVKNIDEFRNLPPQPIYNNYSNALVELRGIKPKEELRGIRGAKQIVADKEIRISPALQGQAFLRYGGTDMASNIIGINPKMKQRTSNPARDMTTGSFSGLQTNSNGIILGQGLSGKLAVHMGSKVFVISPAGVI